MRLVLCLTATVVFCLVLFGGLSVKAEQPPQELVESNENIDAPDFQIDLSPPQFNQVRQFFWPRNSNSSAPTLNSMCLPI
jgi:hypothetical protein